MVQNEDSFDLEEDDDQVAPIMELNSKMNPRQDSSGMIIAQNNAMKRQGRPAFFRHSDSFRLDSVRNFNMSGASSLGGRCASKSSQGVEIESFSLNDVEGRVKTTRRKFGQNVWSDKVPIGALDKYDPPKFDKDPAVKDFLMSVLESMFLFADLNKEDLHMLVDAMLLEEVKRKDVIINQGDVGDYFYIVDHGNVAFYVGEKNVGSGNRGKSFGELALMYACPRTASCIAKTDCKLWKIDQKTFRYVMVHCSKKSEVKVLDALKKVSIFTGLTENYYKKLADAMERKVFERDEVIIRKGEVGHEFYVIQSGQVCVSDKGTERRKSNDSNSSVLGEGQAFGERALLTGDVRSATVVTFSEKCELLCLSRFDFERILGSLDGLLERSRWSHIISSVPQFTNMSQSIGDKNAMISFDVETIKELELAMKEVHFKADDIIMNKGDLGDTFYIIQSGNVSISHVSQTSMAFDVSDRILGPNEYFGERSLFTGELRSATVSALTDVTCKCLMRTDAERILSPMAATLERARWRRVLLEIPLVLQANLSPEEIEIVIDNVEKKDFCKGTSI